MAAYLFPEDIIGEKFLKLSVISVEGKFCTCVCECGKETTILKRNLGKTISCGCARTSANKSRIQDIAGKIFGRLTVLHSVSLENGTTEWLCSCQCGSQSLHKGKDLRSGNNRSCGCLWEEACRNQVEKIAISRRLAKGFPEDFLMSSHNRIEREKTKPLVRRILNRDEECCAWCSIQRTEKTIEVHHLVPWSESEELRFSERNLVSLCKDCHWKIHQNNMRGPVDASMTILLQGFANYQEDLVHGLL